MDTNTPGLSGCMDHLLWSRAKFLCGTFLLSVLFCFLPVPAQSADESSADYLPNDPDSCLLCHSGNSDVAADNILQTVHGLRNHPDSPMGDGQAGCQSCHGPSAAHLLMSEGVRNLPSVVFDDRQAVPEQNAVCLDCHTRELGHDWPGSVHEFAELSCANCHYIHQPQ